MKNSLLVKIGPLLGLWGVAGLSSVTAAPIALSNADFSTAGAQNNTSIPGWTRYNSVSNGFGVNGGSDGAPDAPSAFMGNNNGLQQPTAHVIAVDDAYTVRVTASATTTGANAPDLVVEYFADDGNGTITLLGSETIELGTTRDWQERISSFTFTPSDPNAGLAGNTLVIGFRTTGAFLGIDTVLLDEGDLGILYWDGTDIDADANGGAGTWDLVATNWDNLPSAGNDVVWTNGLDAIFGGASGGPVTLDEPIQAGSLLFQVADYELSGSSLSLGGIAPTITTLADVTISSDLLGSTVLTKSGAATLTLSGINAGYNGGLDIQDGTVELQSNFGSAVTVSSTLSGEGSVTGDLTFNADSTWSIDSTTSGALSVDGDIVISGLTELFLSAAPTGDVTLATYTGSVEGNLTDLAYLGRGEIVDTGSALVLQNAIPADLVWNNFGATNFWSVGDEFDDINWDNAGTNDFFFAGDSVTFTDTAAGTVTLFDGEGALAPSSVTFTNSLGSDYSLVPDIGSGGISGTTSLVKNGAGTVALSAINTYTGGTFVNDGVLALSRGGPNPALVGEVTVTGPGVLSLLSTNALGFNAGQRVDVLNVFDGGLVDHTTNADNGFATEYNLRGSTMQTNGVGRFAFAGGTAVNSLASVDSSTIAGLATIRSSFTFDIEDGAAATDLLVSADLANQGGGTKTITKTGEGVLRFAGTAGSIGAAPENYGPTVVSEGCLIIDGLASITPDLTLVSVAADAGFGAIAGPSNATGADFAAIAANVAWDASGTSFLVVDTNGEDVVISADFVGNYILLKKGAGTLTLSGNVTVETQGRRR